MTRLSRRGFSIVELLIAAAVLGVILSLLGSLFVSTRRAYDVSERVSETRLALQAATEALAYEVGLAGYRGVDVGPSVIATQRPFAAGLPLTVVDGALGGPDSVTVRYYEDRFVSSAPELVTVTFSVVGGQLVRTVGGISVDLVQGVSDFQVISWLNRSATEFVVPTASATANRPQARDLAGIGLRLQIDGRTEPYVMKIALRNPQCQEWPCP